MPTIKVPQLNKEIKVQKGELLMKALLEAGVPVASSCAGDGICGKCKILVHSPNGDLSSPNEVELILRKKLQIKSDERFACQVLVNGDVEVRTSYW